MRKRTKIKQCIVEGCDKLYDTYKGGARGMCVMHYRRWMRNGDPNKLLLDGSGFVNDGGYLLLSRNGKHVRAHREIMENHIGRPLKPTEIVHHKNGDKLDNRIANLEIMSRADHVRHHKPRKKQPN